MKCSEVESAPSKGATTRLAIFFTGSVNCDSYKQHVDMDDLEEFNDPVLAEASNDTSDEFVEFAETVLTIKGIRLVKPKTITEALEMYYLLLHSIDEYM